MRVIYCYERIVFFFDNSRRHRRLRHSRCFGIPFCRCRQIVYVCVRLFMVRWEEWLSAIRLELSFLSFHHNKLASSSKHEHMSTCAVAQRWFGMELVCRVLKCRSRCYASSLSVFAFYIEIKALHRCTSPGNAIIFSFLYFYVRNVWRALNTSENREPTENLITSTKYLTKNKRAL